MPDTKSLFEGGNPKTMFVFGLVSGIAVVSLVLSGVLLTNASGGLKLASSGDADTAKVIAKANTANTVAPAKTYAAMAKVTDTDHQRGSKDAKVTIVAYNDFQCPYSAKAYPTMKQLQEDYGDKINWVYRHFPLNFHPQAEPAAIASECASEQGKFWEFADEMFANQSKLGEDFYIETATKLGLNVSKFTTCLESGTYDKVVASQQSAGASAGVGGTPGTFLNGTLLTAPDAKGVQQSIGAASYATFKSLIDAALAK